MTETKQADFKGWAIVEMMGHQRECGFVTTEVFGQAVLFRIDCPELQAREYTLTVPQYCKDENGTAWCDAGTKVKREAYPARTRYVAPGSLYALNPCTQEAALQALEDSIQRPIIVLERPKRSVAAIEAATGADCECDEDCEGDCDCMCHDPHARATASI
jgi:hypothetical protein